MGNNARTLWMTLNCNEKLNIVVIKTKSNSQSYFQLRNKHFYFFVGRKIICNSQKIIKKDHLKNVAFLSYLSSTRCNRIWPAIILLFVIEKRQIKMKTKKNENEIICFPQKCWWTITNRSKTPQISTFAKIYFFDNWNKQLMRQTSGICLETTG